MFDVGIYWPQLAPSCARVPFVDPYQGLAFASFIQRAPMDSSFNHKIYGAVANPPQDLVAHVYSGATLRVANHTQLEKIYERNTSDIAGSKNRIHLLFSGDRAAYNRESDRPTRATG